MGEAKTFLYLDTGVNEDPEGVAGAGTAPKDPGPLLLVAVSFVLVCYYDYIGNVISLLDSRKTENIQMQLL